MQRFSPRSEGFEPHINLPSPGDVHWEDELAEHVALKTSEAYVCERWRAIGNRDSALKVHTQNLTHSKTQHRGSNLKGAWSDPLADLGEPPGEAGGN